MFALIRPFVPYLIIGLVSAIGIGSVYAFIRHQGVVAERERIFKEKIAAYELAVAKANKVAVALEAQLADYQQKVREVNEKLSKELVKEPVYRECVVPSSGVQLLNAAIGDTSSSR